MKLPLKNKTYLLEDLLEEGNVYNFNYKMLKVQLILEHLDVIVEAKSKNTNESILNESNEDVIRSMYYQPDNYFYNIDYQDTFKKALFITLFNDFESCIDEIITRLNNGNYPNFKTKNFYNRWKYLINIGAISQSCATKDDCDRLRKIRNDIVHHASVITNAVFLNLDLEIPGLKCTGDNRFIVTSSDFIKYTQETFYSMILKLS